MTTIRPTHSPYSRFAEGRATPADDASHLTGICYAAVQTTFEPASATKPNRIYVIDGNGRQSRFDNVDMSLGMVAQHYQALAAHYDGQNCRDFLPGYISPGVSTNGSGPVGQTLVWVLR